MQEKKKYNIALIGAGRMGARWASVIASSKKVSLALVVDKDATLGKKVADVHSVAFSTDTGDALSGDIDAVFIVTPHKYLYLLARESLLAGKHVFVEKPGARTEKEMRELLHIAEKNRRALTVGFNYRFFDSIRQAKQIVTAGTIGEIAALRIAHGHPGRVGYENEWRMNKDLAGGGVLMDQGLHCIDLARWFLDEPIAKTVGAVSNRVWRAEVEDEATLILKTETGKIASLSVSISEWKPIFSCVIRGEKGYIAIEGLGKKYGTGESFSVGTYNREKDVLNKRTIACDPNADKALALEFETFIDTIANESYKNKSAEDAAEVLAIIEKIYEQNDPVRGREHSSK